ncbi:uncharacterized protein L3040_001486 [Drepanopeziza brunnea f. sp. 'multigermtubi']|uniref:Uncharacterized protein n=1 Tax=Marssonina brunnea f. sp. multigermtubi (strain MB_m1) TaxID=1072389 RepID=K1X7X6_MARBU|nr:uncharacterized protein MBM_05217 [Drepanopeziza brunnea f. sp. 'multigermtubi' MB_m1]EKD16748.1 hypothetical protein MBM_05217 [Drepanopeziza brunnea f. sp. 'multigermtubi' MB_m1]KAJ5051713.1 hypothetical protein L3040_001486 [Drepanopeziza brunnea f. sp. 'multigermtubi']
MRLTNALFAAITFAIAVAQDPEGEFRSGQLYFCQDPDFHKCQNITYDQDNCVDLEDLGLMEVMTGFNTFGYGCEFYGGDQCVVNDFYFAFRGNISDLLLSEYSKSNDRITAFRCGT